MVDPVGDAGDVTRTPDGSSADQGAPSCTPGANNGPVAPGAVPAVDLAALSARVGAYAAERDLLLHAGWEVAMRVDLRLGSLTAEIYAPDNGIGRSGSRYTCWRIADPTVLQQVVVALRTFLERHGRDQTYEDRINMNHPLWLIYFASWRDCYAGTTPHGWPLTTGRKN